MEISDQMEKIMLKKFLVLLLIVLVLSACEAINPLIEPLLPPLPPTIETGPTQTPVVTAAVPVPPTATPTTSETPPTVTPTEVVPSATFSPSNTPAGPTQVTVLYHVQTGSPLQIANFAHASSGCQWMSVAGQIFDAAGNPVLNLVVHVTGALDGLPFDQVSMTGVALDYGPGGYEIKLADKGVVSTGTLSIQLFDLQGQAVSNAVTFDTLADCTKAVTLFNFVP
jgi:hypothetical protein